MSEAAKPAYDDTDEMDGIGLHDPLTPGVLGDIKKKLEFELTQKPSIITNPVLDPGQEHMKVYLRVRPFMEHELEKNENQHTIHQDTKTTLTVHAPKDSVTFKNTTHGCGKQTHHFTFSRIFSDSTQQRSFFEETMLGTVKEFVDGQNCLMFTYGVTGSGKTYTILGQPNDSGILPRSLDVVFNSIEGKQWSSMSLKPRMFCDVVALSEAQQDVEQKIKDKVFRLSTENEPDMTAMMGDEMSDMSRSTINTTSVSMPSFNSLGQDTTAESLPGAADSTQAQIDQLFQEAENRDREQAAIDVEAQGQIKFSIWVSFAEIYNEYIYDLLDAIPKKKTSRRAVLKLAEDRTGAPYIRGLKWIHVTTADEAYKILTIGQKNLQVACTKLNQNSSRSHCIFTMKLLRVVDKENPKVARVSMLSFCDLAGSERYKKTQSSGDRLREAGSINRSLLTLGQCIEVLRFNQGHKANPRIVPFRESKLTRLFQNFFCGKGRASMVVNINQNASMFDETLHVLKFSAIAKQVTSVQKVEEKKRKKTISLSMGPNGRASVAWATPGSLKRWMEEEEEEEKRLNVVDEEGEEEDDDEDAVLNESEADASETTQKLLDIINTLRDQVYQEKMKQAMMEVQIREEVVNEMAEQLVQIEQDYSERIEEQRYRAEERADQKLKLYMASVKKSRKRARVDRFEDDDDDYVSSVVLHAEKVKVQEEHKNVVEHLEEEKKSLQTELTKTRFELSAAKTQIEKGIKFDRSMPLNETSDITQTELMENLAQQLEDSKSTATQQELQIGQLNDMLQEAGDMFEMKEIEIERLKAVINDEERRLQSQNETMEELKRLAVDSRQAIEETECKMKQQEETIHELKAEIKRRDVEATQAKEVTSTETAQLVEYQRIINNLEAKCEDLKSQLETESGEYESSKAGLLDSEVKLSEALSKYEQEKIRHNEAKFKIQDLEARLERHEGALTTTIIEARKEDFENELFREREERSRTEEEVRVLKTKMAALESSLKSAFGVTGAGGELEVIVDKLKNELVGAKGQINSAESMISELEEKVKALEGSLETVEQELSWAKDEKSEVIRRISEVKETQNVAEEQLSLQIEEKEVLQSQIQGLEDELQKARDSLESKKALDLDLSDAKLKIGRLEDELKIQAIEKGNLVTKLEIFEEDFGKLDENLIAATQSNEELQEEINDLKIDLNKANGKYKREADQKADSEVIIKNLQVSMERTENKVLSLEAMVLEGQHNEEWQHLENELVESQARVAELESELEASKESLKTQKDIVIVKTEEAQLVEADLEAAKVESVKKSEVVSELEKEIEELKRATASIENMEVQLSEVRLEAEQKLVVYQTQVANLESELETTMEKLKTHEKMDIVKIEEAHKLEKDLEAAKLEIVKMSEAVAKLEGELEELRRTSVKVDHMEVQLSEVRAEAEREFTGSQARVAELESDLEAAREKLKAQENTNIGKAEEADKLLADLKTAKSEADKRNEKVLKLEAELEDLKRASVKVEHMEVQLSEVKLEAERSVQLEQELEALKVQNNDLRCFESELEEARLKIKDLESVMSQLEAAKNRVACLEKDLGSVRDELADRTLKLQGLEHSAEELSKENETLLAQAKQNNEVIIEIQGKEESLSSEIKILTDRICDLEKERDDALARNNEFSERVQSLETESDTCRKEHDGRVKELDVRIVELESSLEEMDEELSRQSTSKARSEEQRTQAEAKLKRFQSLLDKAEMRLVDVIKHREKAEDNVEALKQKTSKLSEECNELKVKVTEAEGLEQTLRDTEANLRNVEEKLAEKEAESEQLSSKSSEVETLDHKVRDLEQKIANLSSELENQISLTSGVQEKLDEKSVEVVERDEKIQDLEAKLQTEQFQRDVLESDFKEVSEELERVKSEFSDMETKLCDIGAKLDGQKVEKAVQIEALQMEVEELQEKMKSMKESYEKELKGKEEGIKEMKQAIRELEIARKDLEAIRTELDAEKTALEVRVTDLRCEIDAERLKRGDAEREVGTLKAQVEGLQTDVEMACDSIGDVSKAKEFVNVLKADLEGANVCISEQKCRLDSLEAKLNSRENEVVRKEASLQEMQTQLKNDEELLAKMKVLEKKLAKANKDAETTRGLLADQDELATEQENYIKKMEKDCEDLKKERDDLDTMQKRLEKEIKDVLKRELSLKSEKKNLLAEINRLDRDAKDSETDTDMDSLKQELSVKEEQIEELQTKLESLMPKTRSTRRGRGSKAQTSLDTGTEENYLLELKKLSDELEKEKHKRKIEKEKYTKDMSAKDQIIGDLKDTNNNLASRLPNNCIPSIKLEPVSSSSLSTDGGIENIDPMASGIDLSTLNIPMESFCGQVNLPSLSPEPVKRKTRGRPRKTQSNESETEPTPSRSTRKSRKPTSSTKKTAPTTALKTSPQLSSMDFQYAPASSKRKRRLYKEMDPLLESGTPAKMTTRERHFLSSGCHCDCHSITLVSPCHKRCCRRCTCKQKADDDDDFDVQVPKSTAARRRLRTSTRV